jgi:hypothetical protein
VIRVLQIFRWARLEDLINEGRKVGGIREDQLWSFLHWLVSEQKVTPCYILVYSLHLSLQYDSS